MTLKENYTNFIIDSLDMDGLIDLAFDSITKSLDDYSDDDVKKEILDLYDQETLDSLL